MPDSFSGPDSSSALERILYVEDDPDIREVACLALRSSAA